MSAELVPGLTFVDKQPPCIGARFFIAKPDSAFVATPDDRGQAFAFDRSAAPAAFVEMAHTLADRIRGNHVHQQAEETFHVVSGRIAMYLLCREHNHVYMRSLTPGQAVAIHKGTPHTMYSIDDSGCVVLFDRDPRDDRERVPILLF